MMDETEKYLFEVHGYLLIKGALSPQEVVAANAAKTITLIRSVFAPMIWRTNRQR